MAYTMSWLSLLHLITQLLICYLRISAQQQIPVCDCADGKCQNGDVRLNQNDDFKKANGVLEIYFNSTWIPVCHDNFNEGAAAAACRQLDYCMYDGYREAGSYPNHTTSYDTSDSCPSTEDYTAQGELHLLRCSGQIQQVQCIPVYLYCTEDCKLPQYNGKVSLLANADNCVKSTGTLYLYYNNQLLPVCADNFNQFAADTACRQLGYTGAANHPELPDSQLSWNLGDISICQNKSYPCLKTCSSSPYQRTSCRNFVITCKFDPDQKSKQSPGSLVACTDHQESGSLCNPNKFNECVALYGVLGAAILLCLVLFIIYLCRHKLIKCCHKLKCCKQRNNENEQLLNNGQANDDDEDDEDE